jgi:hypothetical protein
MDACYFLETWSDELDASLHLFLFEDFPDKRQTVHDIANATGLLATVGDAGVRNASGVNPQEILILSENNPLLGNSVGNVLVIGSVQQTRLGGRRYVDATTTQARGDCWVTIFVKMEPNRPWHSAARSSPGAVMNQN